MSAIWGAIDLSGKQIEDHIKEKMKASFKMCAIDCFSEMSDENVYMGCGIQFFTPESVYEQLPCMNDEKIFFDADVVLDNRKELLDIIGIKEEVIADGEILRLFIEKSGTEGFNELLGAYAFVQYNREDNRVLLCTDAVGNRCVYYRICDNILYYSSLIETLLVVDRNYEINGQWMLEFLAMDSLMVFADNKATPINQILRVPVAHYVEITKGKCNIIRYWDAMNSKKKFSCKNDEEYKKTFNEIMTSATKCVLRSEGETGIFLSGGFDSTAVACVAAPLLKVREKKLYSYTFVPENRYRIQNDDGKICDESELVKKTAEVFENIECKFFDLNDTDIWERRHEYIDLYEMPYKSIENLAWIAKVYQMAKEKNIKIILSGENGNSTASYSDVALYLQSLLNRKKIFRFMNEITVFCRKYGYSRKSAIQSVFYARKKEEISEKEVIRKSFVKKESLEKYHVISEMQSFAKTAYEAQVSVEKIRNYVNQLGILRQMGEYDTKLSLRYGVLLRDPMKDKRMIEFCMNIPFDQFQKEGEERRLVSVYMKDIIPEHIFAEKRRGKQSGDMKAKLTENWENIKAECVQLFENNMDNPYVDCDEIVKYIKMTPIKNMNDFDIMRIVYSDISLEYCLAHMN